MVFTGLGPFNVRVAAMNSAPSSGPSSWGFDMDRFRRPSWVGAVRAKASASLELGGSYNRGPWMEGLVAGQIHAPPQAPPGTPTPGWRTFDQEIISADFAWARGPMVIRGEAMFDRWEVPNTADDPRERAYTLSAQWDLRPGLFAAVRGGLIDFRPVDDGLGAASKRAGGQADWDYDVTRWEASLGYRLARNVGATLSGFRQDQRESLDPDGDTRLLGLRLWWAF